MKLATKIAYFIASGFGSGSAKRAPGTFGSLAFLIIFTLQGLLFSVSEKVLILDILILSLLGTAAVELCLKSENNKSKSKNQKSHDPSWIVVDEWLGMAVALLPATRIDLHLQPLVFSLNLILAFALFRCFDILKPPPVSSAEKLPGAFGVMADDLVAGFISAGILVCIN